jgi:hypothetical protein
MVHGELLRRLEPEAFLERGLQFEARARVASSIESPEPPRDGTTLVSESVQENEPAPSDTRELRDDSFQLVVVQVVRDGDAEAHVDSVVRKREHRRVARRCARAWPAAAEGGEWAGIDVEKDRVHADARDEAALRASDVEQPRR